MDDDYVIRESRPDEAARLVDFLAEHHAKEDVATQGFVRKHNEPTTFLESTGFVVGNVVLVAVTRGDEEIVGTVLLCPAKDELGKSDSADRRLAEFHDAVARVLVQSGLYERFDADTVLNIRKLAVHREHRGRGLAKRLIQAGVNWAKQHGYKTAFGAFTTPASRRAAERVGFVKFADYDLREFKDSRGERILADCGDNNVIAFMTMRIE